MKKTINRRDFMKASSLAGMGMLIPPNPLDTLFNLNIDGRNYKFPKGFLWGVASASAQVESRNGRGRTDWDIFSDWSGLILDGSNNKVLQEFESRYKDEISLLSKAGVQAFRFSFNWARIQPDGPGAPSEKGLDNYDRIIDTMLENGIEPFPTIIHMELPAWAGDFRYRDITYRMADYTEIVTKRFGDRVKRWIMQNEPNTVSLEGYGAGKYAPGLKSGKAMGASIHHQNLANALMMQAARKNLPSGTEVGTTINLQSVKSTKNSPADQKAVEFFDAMWNKAFMDPIYGDGNYCDIIEPLAKPFIVSGDMELMKSAKPDFLGMNNYCRWYAKADPSSPIGLARDTPPKDTLMTSYFPVEPDGMTEMLLRIKKDYNSPKIYITETGFSLDDPAPKNGIVEDPLRVKYISMYLKAVHNAIEKGVDVHGLMYWSSTDNWEWSNGYTKKFGLIHVDPATQIRTPKRSLEYFGKCAKNNSVLPIK